MLLRSFFARYHRLAFFCSTAILIAIAGKAEANITYTLNPIAGNDGTTLTGVITTDGATGPLATTDILGATFESPGNIVDGFTTFTGAAQLSQISATNSGLLFDGFSSSLLFTMRRQQATRSDLSISSLRPANLLGRDSRPSKGPSRRRLARFNLRARGILQQRQLQFPNRPQSRSWA